MEFLDRLKGARGHAWRGIASAVGGPAAVTSIVISGRDPDIAAAAVLYVLAVVVASRTGGAMSGIAASLLSFLSLNFFLTQPLHTFAVASVGDLITLLAFLGVSMIVGLLLSGAVEARTRAEQREAEALLLNRVATRLLAGDPPEEALAEFAEGVATALDLGRCEISTTLTASAECARAEVHDPPLTIRLAARGRELGEMRAWGKKGRLRSGEIKILNSLGSQLGLALEGARLSLEVRRAELEAHSSSLKAALFSGVTHDVKTPLAAIMTAVTSLIEGRGFSEDEQREHLGTIRQEAERLHRVVNNLLDVARLRAGALVTATTPSPIDELMESVLNRLRPILQDRALDIRVGEDVPNVPMDVVQIDQVLTNLIENAVKFTPPGTPISLRAVGHRDVVRVTVADRGPGIAGEDRERIFEPFERGEIPGAGTGLGLAISHAIVAAHGGRMWVSEDPRGGAAFTFELPCLPAPVEGVTDERAGARR